MVIGIGIDILLFFVVAGNAVIGYRRGLARVIFNICSTIVALILVLILYKPTLNYFIEHTQIEQKLQQNLEEKLGSVFPSEQASTVPVQQEDDNRMNLLKQFIGDDMGSLVQETTETVIQSVSSQVAYKIMSVIVFFALFALIRLVLYVLKNYVELVANLPIIRVINGSGGMIYGIIKGFLLIYVLFAILTLIMPIMDETSIITAIQSAPIGGKMFENNILLNLIFKFL